MEETQKTVTYEALGWYRDDEGNMTQITGVIDPRTGVVTFERAVGPMLIRPVEIEEIAP